MKSLLTTSSATFALLLLMAPPSWADTGDIRASDKALEFDVGGTDIKYGETINGTSFDTENGWMPSFDLGLTWLTPSNASYMNDVYLHIDAQASFGNTGYNGGIQSCSGGVCTVTPAQGTTNDQIYRVSGRIGRFIDLGDDVALTPFIDLGFRSWQRDLTGAAGYNENYRNGEGMAGLLLQISPMPKLVLSAAAEAGSTLGPEMTTQHQTYTQGSGAIWQVEGKAGYAFTPKFELTGGIQYGGFAYGESSALGDGSYEPNSYTHQLSLLGGVAYHLQ